jgi:hypothetical protein
MPDNNEIVRQQAEKIEALESEIVQLYSELYPKQKHKSKRQPPAAVLHGHFTLRMAART